MTPPNYTQQTRGMPEIRGAATQNDPKAHTPPPKSTKCCLFTLIEEKTASTPQEMPTYFATSLRKLAGSFHLVIRSYFEK